MRPYSAILELIIVVVGELPEAVDVLVLGAGPGGYAAAIRAAQLGRQVLLVDPREAPGGTCLHDGCIPAKALLSATEAAARIPALAEAGINAGPVQVDYPALQAWRARLGHRLAGGVAQLLHAHKVQVVQGRGWFTGPDTVHVDGVALTHKYHFQHCILATGAGYAPAPGALDPVAALRLTQVPAVLAVAGSHYVAAELATLFARLGARVTLDTGGAPLLAEFDPGAGRLVQARLKQLGVALGPAPAGATRVDCAPPVAATADLGLPAAGVATGEGGWVRVDRQMRTSVPSVWAVGDVTGGPGLATVALAQAKVAAESLAGLPAEYAPRAVPRVAHTDPEVAEVGLGAAAARARGLAVQLGRFPFGASGRALGLGAAEGSVTVVAEGATGVVLGVTIVGPRAGDLIGEAALALEMGATLEDLALTLHPHPGLPEALQEGAEAALGRAIHVLKPF